MEKFHYASRFIHSLRTRGLALTFKKAWIHFWMHFAGRGPARRFAAWLVTWFAPPHYDRWDLRFLNPKGFVSPSATLHGKDIRLGPNIFVDDHALLFQPDNGGPITIGARTAICRNTIISTEQGGAVTIGEDTRLQPHCFLSAAKGSIRIGANVGIAPYCAFYPHDHGIAGGKAISGQSLTVKGDIVVEDGAWLAHGVTVLSGVRIGKGAVIGAGSTVAENVPDGALASGVPARIFMTRGTPEKTTLLKSDHGALNPNIARQVRQVAADVYVQDNESGEPPETLNDWDSMQRLNLVLAIEETFPVRLGPDDLGRMQTLAELALIVQGKLANGQENSKDLEEWNPKSA